MQTTSKELTLGEVATQFLTKMVGKQRPIDQQEINRFVRWYGADRSLKQITYHDVENYSERFSASLKDAAEVLKPLKDFFAYAKDEGLHATNLGKSIKLRRNPARDTIITKREITEQEIITKEGFDKLTAELESLKFERVNIAQMLRLAMADKDFRENAPLDAAREHQGMVEAKIRELEAILRRAQVSDSVGGDGFRVSVGSTVVIRDLDTNEAMKYTLVHPNEVNLAAGKISVASPTGKSLLDRIASDIIEVVAPSGVLKYKIESIGG